MTLAEVDFPEIEAFLDVQKVLHPHQFPAWGMFQASLGIECVRLGVRSTAGVLVGYAQIFGRSLPLGFTWLHIPRGPVVSKQESENREQEIADLMIAKIKELGIKKRTIFIRFDFPETFNLIPRISDLSLAPTTNFPDTTLFLDLTRSEAELLAGMKPKGRYNIRLAKKHSIVVRELTTPETAQIFYRLLKKTTARDGFSAHSEDYYAQFLNVLSKRKNASCFLAEKDGTPLAASLVTFFGRVATYYYGASDHAYRNLMAPYLVQWTAICAAKQKGFEIYDFLGIAPEGAETHRLAGVTDFKRKFGGGTLSFPKSSELVLRPIVYRMLGFLKKVLQSIHRFGDLF